MGRMNAAHGARAARWCLCIAGGLFAVGCGEDDAQTEQEAQNSGAANNAASNNAGVNNTPAPNSEAPNHTHPSNSVTPTDDITVDLIDYACADANYVPGECVAGAVVEGPAEPARQHIALPTPIVYSEHPPSTGDHRPQWGRWGVYEYMPPQRFIHNLEHGGVVLLYDPCASAEVVEQLRAFALSIPADDGGEFRWVLSPYPGLPTQVAALAWRFTYTSECVNEEELRAFVEAHYRQAPEDIGAEGSYSHLWLGR